jgi:large subunit ribosomal protein L13
MLIEHAVKGMIPKNRLGRVLLTKLKVFKGPKHPHAAQQPAALKAEGQRADKH